MKRLVPGRYWSVLGRFGLLSLLAVAAVDGSGRARAQGTGDPPPSEPNPTPTPTEDVVAPTRAYFEQYPDEASSIPFEALSAADQEGVMHAAEVVDTYQGDAVHQAWSAYSRDMVDAAEVQRAAHQSATQGLETVGVVP